MGKRILSLVLALALVCKLLPVMPVTSLAETNEGEATEQLSNLKETATSETTVSDETVDNSEILTLEAPSSISKTEITVTGIAPAQAEVSIYLNGTSCGSTTADASGIYSLNISLGEPTESVGYTLKAECVGSDGLLHFSDSNTYKMLVDDGLDVCGKAVELEMTFLNEATDEYMKLETVSGILSDAGSIVSIVGETYNIHQDMEELRSEIAISDNVTDKTAAYKAVDELETDQIAFALAITALPIIATGGVAAPAAGTLFAAIIGVMSAASDVVYQHRVAGIKGESISTNWYSNVTPGDTIQIGDNLYCTKTEVWDYWVYNGVIYDSWIVRQEWLIHGYGPMWESKLKFWNNREELELIEFEPGLTTISGGAFDGCWQIDTIVLPDTVQSIGTDAFADCTGLKSVIIPNSVVEIGAGAFGGCKNLQQITIPDSVETIGGAAFSGCEALSSVSLGDGLKHLGKAVFSGCTQLTSIELPSSLETAGCRVFADCSIAEITIPKNLQNVEDTACNSSPWCSFLSHSGIKTVYFEYGSTIVADHIVSYADSVEKVHLPSAVVEIGEYAFARCTSLTEVDMSSNVRTIGTSAFDHCTSLKTLQLSEALKSIDAAAFWGAAIEELFIPKNVDTLIYEPVYANDYDNEGPFYAMESLLNIYVDSENPVLSSNDGVLFDKGQHIIVAYPGARTEDYSIPEGVETIACNAFASSKLVNHKLTIPASVKKIETNAFYGYNALAEFQDEGVYEAVIYFEGDCPSIEWKAFSGAEVDVYYPKGNSSWDGIEEYTFGAVSITWNAYTPGSGEDQPAASPFVDISGDAYYYNPILWAVENGITTGVSGNTFAPDATCTRAQIVTFLWRANGSPAPASSNNPFTDVPAGQWYTDAVLWAVEQGITTGTSATTFSPDASCTRGQVATFLHRAQGKPASSGTNIFTDLEAGAYYYDAVLWAVANGITNGMGDGTFAPDATCTRGQIVTFLYRAMA